MPSRNSVAVAAVIVALVATSLVAWMFHREDGGRDSATGASGAIEPDDASPRDDAEFSVGDRPVTPTTPAAPLPPPGAAFETIAGDLVARANAGDAAAACRLSLELLRCKQLLRFGGHAPEMAAAQAAQAEGEGDPDLAERLLHMSDRLAPLEASCAAVDPSLLDQAPRWLRQAALAGDREARLQYIDGRNLFGMMDFSFLDQPHFDAWRREAPELLAQALADGEPQAAIWMAEGRGGGEGAIQGLLRDDRERAQAWIAVVDGLFDDGIDMPVPVAPPDAVRERAVVETAARWQARWYGDRRFTASDRPVLDLQPWHDPRAVDVGVGCGRMRAGAEDTGADGGGAAR